MKQNIYDDPRFFQGYAALRRHQPGFAEAIDVPAMISVMPALRGLRVLDLGCGFGKLARHLRELGAARVTAVDLSARMLARAREDTDDDAIAYVRGALEELQFAPASFNLITSSLALHYVAEPAHVFQRAARWLIADGHLVFSVEHPIYTARAAQEWCIDAHGRRAHWPVDDYQMEGLRRVNWFVDGVVKYHRTLATWVNDLIDNGFSITRVLEPKPSETMVAKRPEWCDESRRPIFLVVAAHKAPVSHAPRPPGRKILRPAARRRAAR